MDKKNALVDFHCHLDLFPDFEDRVRECEELGIHTLTVTTTPRAWPKNFEVTRTCRFVRAALGLHPQLAEECAHELPLWKEYLPQTRYVGEVGLDASPKYYRSFALQKEVFASVLEDCSRLGNKILTVHSVRSVTTVLEMIESHSGGQAFKTVLHWFTGTPSDAQRAIDLGCYFSVNKEMLRKPANRNLVSKLPFDRVLTETDAPFTSVSARPSNPADVQLVVDELAAMRGVTRESIAIAVRANLAQLCSSD